MRGVANTLQWAIFRQKRGSAKACSPERFSLHQKFNAIALTAPFSAAEKWLLDAKNRILKGYVVETL